MTALTRRRIRPPGAADERYYSWRSFTKGELEAAAIRGGYAADGVVEKVPRLNLNPNGNGHHHLPADGGASRPHAAAIGGTPAACTAGLLPTLEYTDVASLSYDGGGLVVAVRRAAPPPALPEEVLMAEVVWAEPPKKDGSHSQPHDILQRWTYPKDTVVRSEASGVVVHRTDDSINLVVPREQLLHRVVRPAAPAGHLLASAGASEANGNGSTGADAQRGVYVMTHQSVVGEKQVSGYVEGDYLVQYVEVSTLGDADASAAQRYRMKVYQCKQLSGVPKNLDPQVRIDALAQQVRRVASGVCVVDGWLGQQCRDMRLLDTFVGETADDHEGFEKVKDIWVAPLKEYVGLYRRAEPSTAHPVYRCTAEIDGSVSDFITLVQVLKTPGSKPRQTLTPECEEQGIHVDDATARIIYKIDKIGPWPLKRRQYLALSVLGWAPNGTCYFVTRSISDSRFPTKSSNQEGLLHNLGYRCEPGSREGRIRLTQLIHVDPVGMFPKGAFEMNMHVRVQNLGLIHNLLRGIDAWRPKV